MTLVLAEAERSISSAVDASRNLQKHSTNDKLAALKQEVICVIKQISITQDFLNDCKAKGSNKLPRHYKF